MIVGHFYRHTPYCDVIGCDKWKITCDDCELKKEYPKTLFDHSKRNWNKKKKILSGINGMLLVAPSKASGISKRIIFKRI